MGTAVKAATRIQIGKETTRGTLVAATRRILTPGATHRIIEEQEEFTEHQDGLLTRASINPIATLHHTEFEIPITMDYEQILLPLLSGVKGGVTPSTPGSGEARLWTFTPGVAADPAPTSYTIEWVTSDFATFNEWEAGYVLTESFEITAADSGMPELTMSMFGRKSAESTYTSGLALPTLSSDFSPNPRWDVSMDNTWSLMTGTRTAVSGQIYGITLSWATGIRPGYYLDNRSDLDFSAYEYGRRTVDLTFDVVHSAASGGFVETEQTKKAAKSKRYCEVRLQGPAFSSPDAGLNRHITIRGAWNHAPDSMESRGADRDGSVTTSVHLQSFYDPDQAQDVQVFVQNNIASFP